MANPPAVQIPSGSSVRVSVIDSTTRFHNLPINGFIQPSMTGYAHLHAVAYSFLIEHPSSGKYLFDLACRKDWEQLSVVDTVKIAGTGADIKKNVAEILQENGVKTSEIQGIFWRRVGPRYPAGTGEILTRRHSHWHFDHRGDPSTFPPTTSLIVGPGFKENFMPGFPQNSKSPVLESDYNGRELREIDFSKEGHGLKIGRFDAMDFFGDGSLYLLDSPGHAIGHFSALARTSASPATFIFMAGDVCHHAGELRPSEYLPIPHDILPNPLEPTSSRPCAGAMFEQVNTDRGRKKDEPFFRVPRPDEGLTVAHDAVEAQRSIGKAQELDVREDIMTMFAHDDSLVGVVDFFPAEASDWKKKGWDKDATWAFLKDFGEAVRRG